MLLLIMLRNSDGLQFAKPFAPFILSLGTLWEYFLSHIFDCNFIADIHIAV